MLPILCFNSNHTFFLVSFISQRQGLSWKQQWWIMHTLTSQLMWDKIIKRGRWIICTEALRNIHESFKSQLSVVWWVSEEMGTVRDSDKCSRAQWPSVLVEECPFPCLCWILLVIPEHCHRDFSFSILSCLVVDLVREGVWCGMKTEALVQPSVPSPRLCS